MGKANYVLLALGLGAVLALSIFMQHLLRATKDHKQSPVVREMVSIFGARMFGEPGLKVEPRDGKKHALLSVRALAGVDKQKLARDVGEYLWRRIGVQEQLVAVEIACFDELDASVANFPVKRPLDFVHGTSRPASPPQVRANHTPYQAPSPAKSSPAGKAPEPSALPPAKTPR